LEVIISNALVTGVYTLNASSSGSLIITSISTLPSGLIGLAPNVASLFVNESFIIERSNYAEL
jgi:hypothetical protein